METRLPGGHFLLFQVLVLCVACLLATLMELLSHSLTLLPTMDVARQPNIQAPKARTDVSPMYEPQLHLACLCCVYKPKTSGCL